MAYTVFARKYRPQTFEALVGQEHVARTLAGAIETDRVAHAFLFTGVRGVGKTTTARLLAKALCCEKGPTPTPCNECDPCKDITAGVDIDVQEIDGASNNGVDDVRRLQESLPFRPARDRFKIVIVDEVHMLSTGAFNAFLKTLEEPPPHVKFIFATTESHKVPITIRSRCQRHDFRLIPQATIAQRVRDVLKAEGVGADDDAIGIVAREASGSMRDALTLLDQLVASSAGGLTGAQVTAQLGIAARDSVHGVVRAILHGDPKTVLLTVDSATTRGADPLHFTQQLVRLVRDLVVLQTAGEDTELVQLVREERAAASALLAGHDPLTVQRAFASIAKLTDEVAKAASPRMALEMGLVRLATRPPLRGLADLVARLERLEQGGGDSSGGSGASGAGGAGGSRGGPTSSASTARSAGSRASNTPEASRVVAGLEGGPTDAASGERPKLARSQEPTELDSEGAVDVGDIRSALDVEAARKKRPSAASLAAGAAATPEPAPRPSAASLAAGAAATPEPAPRPSAASLAAGAAATPEPAPRPSAASLAAGAAATPEPAPREPRPSAASLAAGVWVAPDEGDAARRAAPTTGSSPPGRSEARLSAASNGAPSVAPREVGPDEPSAPASSEPSADADTARGPSPGDSCAPAALRRPAMQEWEEFVDALREGRPALAAVLEHGVPRVVSAERIVLSFQQGSFYGRQADAPASRAAITEVAQRRLGARPPIEIRYDAEPGSTGRTVAAVEATRRDAERKQRKRGALAHPIVRTAMQVFSESNGRVRVRLDE